MNKFLLTKDDVYDLVQHNKFALEDRHRLESRCIDGRYENDEAHMHALAIPGGTAGELALIYATANTYGFDLEPDRAFDVLTEIRGGVEYFSFHTDDHSGFDPEKGGCGHMTQIRLHPEVYNLEKEDLEQIRKQIEKARKMGAKEMILHGQHMEGAVLLVQGNYGVLPRFQVETDLGLRNIEIFIYHQSLANERYKALAQKLIEKEAVTLYNGCDAEYLYEAFLDVDENHLFETLNRLAVGLPLYEVQFAKDGTFNVEELDVIVGEPYESENKTN